MKTQELQFKITRQEELEKDVKFQKFSYDGVKFNGETETFHVGDIVSANYTITLTADLPTAYDIPYYRGIAQIDNAISAMAILYGHKIIDKKFFNSKLKKFLPEISCNLVSVKRDYETYVRTGRGGRYDYKTETNELLPKKTSERDL